MFEALSIEGRSDVALAMTTQTTYPSYGYMLQGKGNQEPATTIWELWDSDKEGPGMNSRNHIMVKFYGSSRAEDACYKTLLTPLTSTLVSFYR